MYEALWKRRYLILVLVVVAGALYWASVCYTDFLDQCDLSRWQGERQQSLETLGERMLQYAAKHNAELPHSMAEMVDLGVIARSEVDFVESHREVHVVREYRPVPTTALPGDLLLVIERYEPPQEGVFSLRCGMLMLNGDVWHPKDLMEMLDKDSQLRAANGLSVLP